MESGIEEVDSDDGIDEGQCVCPRHVLQIFWLETRFIPGHMGNVEDAPSGPCSGQEIDVMPLESLPAFDWFCQRQPSCSSTSRSMYNVRCCHCCDVQSVGHSSYTLQQQPRATTRVSPDLQAFAYELSQTTFTDIVHSRY